MSIIFFQSTCTLFAHCCMWFGIAFGTMAQVWIPDIYTDVFHLRSDVFHSLMFFLLGFSMFSILFCAFVIDIYIKPENFLFYTLLCVSVIFCGLASILYFDESVERFILVHFILTIPMSTMWSVVYAVTPRCFPENLRSASLGVCGFWKYIGCIVAPAFGGWIMSLENIETGYAVYLVGFAVALFGAWNIITPPIDVKYLDMGSKYSETTERMVF